MQGHRIGYVRVGTFDQNLGRQLEHVQVDKVFTDKASGKDMRRLQLDALLAFVRLGRTRWKVENEQYNVHKNGGYALEHNFGHGQHGLATVLYFLNLLAFVAHRVLERSDARYRRIRSEETPRGLWEGLRVCFHRFVVETWSGLLALAFPPEQESG